MPADRPKRKRVRKRKVAPTPPPGPTPEQESALIAAFERAARRDGWVYPPRG